jgi:hypothetical protein
MRRFIMSVMPVMIMGEVIPLRGGFLLVRGNHDRSSCCSALSDSSAP